MLEGLGSHQASRDVQSRESTLFPEEEKAPPTLTSLRASLPTHVVGIVTDARAIFYTWTSLCPNMQCFLTRTHLARSLNWSSEISWPDSNREGFLSFSRWQAAFGKPRDEARERCWCYRVCCESYYPREASSSGATASITLSRPLQRSWLPVTPWSQSQLSSRALHQFVTPSLLTFSVISLTWHGSPEAGCSFLPQPCPHWAPWGESPPPHSFITQAVPGAAWRVGESPVWETSDLGLPPAAEQGTELLRICVFLSANGHDNPWPTSAVSAEDQKIILAARKR